jgi:hypothetical protein
MTEPKHREMQDAINKVKLFLGTPVKKLTQELSYLYSWLTRIHPEQLRARKGELVSSKDYIAENLDAWRALQ